MHIPFLLFRCVLLVLESARVEVDVILNELGYLKYEAPKDSLSTAENILVKQRNLGVTFSLLEKVIKFVSSFAEAEGTKFCLLIHLRLR